MDKIRETTPNTFLLINNFHVFFEQFLDPKYTANMELMLDNVASGSANSIVELQKFYNGFYPIYMKAIEEMPKVEDETTDAVVDEGKGCKAQGGTFWLQFANIALATLLIVLVLFIIVKHFRKNFKKQAKIKSHYNVSSRNKVLSETKKAEKIEKAVNKVNEEPT